MTRHRVPLVAPVSAEEWRPNPQLDALVRLWESQGAYFPTFGEIMEHESLTHQEHAERGFCAVCWGDAFVRAEDDPAKSQREHYEDIVRERSGAGSDGGGQ